MHLLERLRRRGRRRAEQDPAERAVSVLAGETIRVDAGSGEGAEELLDVLGKHGLTCRRRRVGGAEVEISCLEDAEPRRTLETAQMAVELWLLLDPSRTEAVMSVGRVEVPVARPAPADAPVRGPGGYPASPASPAG